MELGKSIENQNDVVVRFAKHVITTVAKDSNLVFSPISINVILSLIADGSNDNTKEQILSFLMSPSLDHLNAFIAKIISVVLADCNERSDLCLSVANGVWIGKYLSLKPSLKVLLENSYKATFSQVDFLDKPVEVIDEVNAWAKVNAWPKVHTNGLIKKILKRDCIETIKMIRASSLILGNAVYFKGAWSEKFDAKLTKDNKFYLLDGTYVKVPYKDQYLSGYDGFQVLRLQGSLLI